MVARSARFFQTLQECFYRLGLKIIVMEKFVINGGKPLQGEIEVRGSKNAAGPCLAAALLTDEECTVANVPFVEDILNILEILKSMGVNVEKIGEESIKIKAETVEPEKMDFEKISKTRISV